MHLFDLTYAVHIPVAVAGGAELLDQSKEAAQVVAENWEQAWTNMISPQSGLYAALTKVGRIIAVVCLMFWGTRMLVEYAEHQSVSFFHEMIWPLIVILLLGSNGAELTELSLGVRNVINTVNQEVLANTSASISLTEAYEKAQSNAAAKAQIGALLEQCQALTGEQQLECLSHARTQSEEIIEAYGLQGNWATNLLRRIDDAVAEADNIAEAVFFAPFNALIGAARQTVARGFLIAVQIAFQQLLEVSLLLTALLGPLAVGLTLLPVGAKAIYAWLTSMLSVGIAKLSFNIMAGTAATIVASADAGDSLWFLIYAAIFAPFLAMALAAGGGMAIWSSITSNIGFAANLAISRGLTPKAA